MTSPAYALVMVALVVMTYLVLAKGPVGSQPTRRDEREIVITGEGNELRVRRVAPVPYSTLSRLFEDIPSQRPLDAAAFRLVRVAPPEMLNYVLCVTSDGLLVLGEQRQAFDHARGAYVFVRGGVDRSYPPLEYTVPWTWLLDIPVSRERRATLELQATGSGWPVAEVRINATGHP